jgi:hypothetical protein
VAVRAYIAGAAGNYGTICLIGLAADPAIAGVPTTKLTNANCGKLNLALTSSISCDPVTNANAFEWEFKDASNSVILGTVTTTTTNLNLNTISFLQWATQYNVRVRASVNGVPGVYGVSCIIGFIADPAIGGVPATKLRNSDCGRLNFGLTGFAVADAVSGANQYEFEISNASNTTILNTISLASNTLNFITVPLLQWGTQYSIKVRARIGTTWGNFGVACLIGFICDPLICGTPTTKLRNADCGKLNFLLSSGYMVADIVSGATLYEFEIRNLSTNNIITQQRTITTIFFNSIVPALQSNTQYSVRVRATVAGVTGAYGAACTIGFVNGSRETEALLNENIEEENLKNETVWLAYPNPFSSQLNLAISSYQEANNTHFGIYDVAGRMVLSYNYNLSAGENNIELNLSELENGIYQLMIINDKGEIKTIKLLKQ